MRAPTIRSFICALAVVLALATEVRAAPCAGFVDVDTTSSFCSNVEWLKNRGITIGCSSLTLYCPSDLVSRLSMAVFLQRLGNALTPTRWSGYNSGSSLDLEASPVVCPSGIYTVPAFPQTAHGWGLVHAWPTLGFAMDATVEIVSRPNTSAAWTLASPIAASWSAPGNDTRKEGVVLLPPQPLAAGSTMQWGLRVSRTSGSGTAGDVAGWNCQLLVEFENRISASSPFDEE
jgi:hypothetical protein